MLKKIFIGLVLLVVVLGVAAVVIIKIMLTPEKIRETVLPLVEKQIHRKLDYGDIKIGLLSGISISDLKVLEKNGTDEFVSVQKMALHYRFMRLLKGKIDISEIVLDKPKISIIRLEDGSFNFSDMLSAEKAEDTSEKPAPKDSESGGMDVAIGEIRITDGELHFQDRLVTKGRYQNYVLDRFNLKTRDFSLDASFPFDISALVNGAAFKIYGNFNVKTGEGDVGMKLDALDILPFKPYFAESLPGKLDSARLSAKLTALLKKETASSKGEFSIDKVRLTLDTIPEVPLEDVSLGFTYDLSMDLVRKLLNISSVHLALNEIGVIGRGSLDLLPETPVLDFTLSPEKFDLAEFMRKAPAGLVKDYRDYALQGKLSGEVKLAGSIDKGPGLLKSAKLEMDQVSAAVNYVRTGVDGKLAYAGNKLKTDGIDFHYADQHGKLTMDLDYLEGQKVSVRGKFAITADKLDLNKLLPEGGETTGANTPQSAPATEVGPLDLPLDIRGSLSVREMLYEKLPITDAEIDLTLKNNMLTIGKLTGKTAGGTLNADAKVNLAVKGLNYEGKLSLSETNVPQVVSGLFPEFKLYMEGKAVAEATFSGHGTLPATMKRNLQASGKASILDGLVKETQIQNAIALFFGIDELKIVSFESIASNFSIKNNMLNQDSFLDSSGLQLKSIGTVSLDGPLDLVFNTHFSPEFMAKIKGPQAEVTRYLTDETGGGNFALTVKGSMDAPRIGMDISNIKKQTEEVLKDKLKEKLLEKFSDKGPTGTNEAVDPKREAVRDTLEQLFKKEQ